MAQELKSALSEFVRFVQTLRGDEKSEAQTFLDHFFRALGHAGVIEAGATFEFRVAKKPGSPQLELIKGNGHRPKGQFRDYQPGTMSALAGIPRYVSCARVTKRPIFEFISSDIHPDTMLMVFPFADDYSFGILQSDLHWRWFKGRCSTLGGTFRYTSDTVFDTFPWPQEPTRAQIKAVAEAAVTLRGLRRETMQNLNYSLRDLYRTLEQPGDNPLRDAHARLDATVRAAYGMADDADPLAFLLELNLACAAKEKAGKKITPPGLPLPAGEHAEFVTNDCIQPTVPV